MLACPPAAGRSGEYVAHDDDVRPASRARLLVVDDSPTALSILKATLEGRQYEVETASDGAEGLEKARAFSPDLILTDTIMPGVDGFAFLESLKENAAMRSIPVIMLTSAEPSDFDHQDQALPDIFLAKSADLEALIAHIEALLKRPR